ncbi:MAG: glycosyltransferase family 2 protein, partial [Oscillospiraceae bacterium]
MDKTAGGSSHMMDALKLFLICVDVFFVIYLIGYSTFLFLSVTSGAIKLHQRRKDDRLKNLLHHELYIPITIIVPAHNEETTLVDTICTLMEQDYKLFEIVVVDDGSTDKTAESLVEHFHMKLMPRPVHRVIACKKEIAIYEGKFHHIDLTLVKKENGGKADALNMGINISKYPYFICIDADSMLQKNSLFEISKPMMENDFVVACGGQIAVSNGIKLVKGEVKDYSMPKKLVEAMQVLEYERSFLASRIFMNRFNGNLIISGAFGMFKKNTVILAGGYDSSTMGEDMELVVKLHAFCRANHLPYSLQYVPDAICWSQVPGSLPDLMKQRRRWHIGLFESLTKYKNVVGKKEYGLLGTISFLYFWIYELLSPYIELFGLFTIILSFFINLINVPFMILFFTIYASFACILTLTSFFTRLYMQNMHISFSDSMKVIFLCAFELVGLRFILMLVRANALIGYKKKRNVWGELSRVKHNRE